MCKRIERRSKLYSMYLTIFFYFVWADTKNMFKCGIDNDWQLVCVVQKNDFTFRLNMLLRSTKSIRDWSSWIMNHFYCNLKDLFHIAVFKRNKRHFSLREIRKVNEGKTLNIKESFSHFLWHFPLDEMVLDTNLLGKGKESTLDKECKSCTSMFCCLPSESVLAPSLEQYQKFFPEFFFAKSYTHTYLSFVCKNNRGTNGTLQGKILAFLTSFLTWQKSCLLVFAQHIFSPKSTYSSRVIERLLFQDSDFALSNSLWKEKGFTSGKSGCSWKKGFCFIKKREIVKHLKHVKGTYIVSDSHGKIWFVIHTQTHETPFFPRSTRT